MRYVCFVGAVFLMLSLAGCAKRDTPVQTDVQSDVAKLIAEMNSDYGVEFNESMAIYSGLAPPRNDEDKRLVPSGEAMSWFMDYEESLAEKGYVITWNPETKRFGAELKQEKDLKNE